MISTPNTEPRTLGDEMRPVLANLNSTMIAAERRHRLCREAYHDATSGRIPIRDIPQGKLIVWDGSNFADIYFVRLQIRNLSMCLPDESYQRCWRALPQYQPPPLTMPILWGKPQVTLFPHPTFLPADWARAFPPFHYWPEDMRMCVGQAFRIGEANDPSQGLEALAELLSWVNWGDLIHKFHEFPWHPWDAWASAITALRQNKPQLVFEPIARELTFD